jgi:putative nucleotidyltransferase with HDIG domain
MFKPEYLQLFATIHAELDANQKLYLVGGAVRDVLLGRQLHDLDFVLGQNPTALAKRLANRLKVGFFVLDDARHTARVVYHDQDGRFFPLDFVQYTGNSLKEDLHNRDFTINAMAIPIDTLSELVDPLNGQADLERGYLRACSDHALLDDPVRVLRGVRLAVQFNLNYDPGLESAMTSAAIHLPRTSYERQRDEFFRLLSGPAPAKGLRECRRFQIFETLLPALIPLESIPASPPHQLRLFEHTIQTVSHLHHLLAWLRSEKVYSEEDDWRMGHALSALSRFSAEIDAYFSKEITPGRSKAALAYFGALLHDIGKPQTLTESEDGNYSFPNHEVVGAGMAWEMAKRLQLSNAESDWIRKMVRYRMGLLPLVKETQLPDRRTLYRFFKKAGDTGVAIAFHMLADTMSTYGSTLDPERWVNEILIVRTMLSAWWEHQETIVSPTPLLDGNDLQEMFGLLPGKHIGRLLGQLVEEQASGNVNTQNEARKFVRHMLSGPG